LKLDIAFGKIIPKGVDNLTMLSKHSRKLLKWIATQNKWLTKSEIQQKCKFFDDRSFDAIVAEKYVELRRSGDRAQLIQYRISEPGRAYLEGAKLEKQGNFREWVSLALSVVAIIISIIALIGQ